MNNYLHFDQYNFKTNFELNGILSTYLSSFLFNRMMNFKNI